ncbi:hypothetical protein SFRURICE_015873, partial [Spodoptera frugiperda]
NPAYAHKILFSCFFQTFETLKRKIPAKCESDSPMKGSRALIFPLWKHLTFKRLILTKNGFRNLDVFFKDLSIDTYHGYVR